MLNLRCLAFAFVCLVTAVQADEPANTLPHAEVEGDPSTIIAGCVNAITGNYSDAYLDLVVVGPEPLPFQRFYCSADWEGGSFKDGWNHNYANEGIIDQDGKGGWYARIPESSGGSMLYFCDRKAKPDYRKVIKLDTNKTKYLDGLTNTGRGQIGARTNLRNQTAEWRGSKKDFTIQQPDGTKRFYHVGERCLNPGKKPILMEYTPRLTTEIRPNGNQIHYHYDSDELTRVTALDATGTVTFGSLSFTRTSWKDNWPVLTVKGSNGQKAEYTFHKSKHKKEKEWRYYIYGVTPARGPHVDYKYSTHNKHHFEQVIEKRLPEGRVQQIEYYEDGLNSVGDIVVKVSENPKKDKRPGKVRLLRAPVGYDDTLQTTHRFFYEYDFTGKDADKYRSGYVDVLDALNHKVRYCFSDKDRLTAIEQYCAGRDDQKYRTEKFFWGNNSAQECNLVSKALLEADDTVRSCRYLEYDRYHNVTAEHILGNISGKSVEKPALNNEGIPLFNGCERYIVNRSYYPSERFNLLQSERLPNGRVTTFRYWHNTHQPEAKFVSQNGQILTRQFHEYDRFGSLIKTIEDDGSDISSDNYTNVAVRRMTYITPYPAAPWVGLPQEVAEKYYDASKTPHEEHFLGKVLNTYTVDGYLKTQEHYDADDVSRYTLYWDYDSMGNVILERNALGQTTRRKFDQNGNKIEEQGPCELYYTRYTYDFSNRLIADEKVCTDGQVFSQHYRYDVLGNRVASIDIFGNETRYEYDEFNRLVCTKLPPTIDVYGALVHLETRLKYDIAGNVVAETDVQGNITRKTYNIRGQPTCIDYPDGTKEYSEYNLDGTLRCQTSQSGALTVFDYDVLGNVIRKEVFSPSHEFLYKTTAVYRGALLITETDANENMTYHTYDAAGRLVKTRTETGWSQFEYDKLGRRYKTIEWIGPSDDDVRISLVEYDLLDRSVEERLEDNNGNVFTRSLYEYDSAGHRCAVTTFTDLGPSITQTFYDAMGKVYKTVDAEGNETLTHYDYRHVNAHDQAVLQTTTIDPLGNSTVTTEDVLGRIVSIINKDCMGHETARVTQYFDGKGNLVKRIDTVKAKNTPDRDLVTERQYDCLGRVSGLFEAVGTSKARQTQYTYNGRGEKEFDILPDGVILQYQYDPLGRLVSYSSSDLTIDYRYSYDGNGNVTSVADEILGLRTLRSYDKANRMVEEVLANGLRSSYEYDSIGRMTKMKLPDGSSVGYLFDAANLKEVYRQDAEGNKLYAHSYLTHDWLGNVTSVRMIRNAGEIVYARDKLSRMRHMRSTHFEEEVPDGGYDAVGNLLKKRRRDIVGEKDCRYAFDPLYQLVKEDGLSSHDYTYDSLNNRLSKDDAVCEIDEINQLLRQGDDIYEYDKRGNRTNHSALQYSYDALGRLTEVKKEGQRWVYQYDSFNRRICKTSYDSAGAVVDVARYLYCDQLELGSFDQSDTLLQFRVLGKGFGAEIGAAIAIEIGQKLFAPVHDQQGSVVALLDPESGYPLEVYRYTAFGEETCFTESSYGAWHEGAVSSNPWRFSSKRCDPETGLVNFGRRYFDPKIGRWATPDPKGYDEGPNLYAYVRNRPLTLYDLYGLQSSDSQRSWFADTYGGAYTIGVYNGLFHPIDTFDRWNGYLGDINYVVSNQDFSIISDGMGQLDDREFALSMLERAGELTGACIFASETMALTAAAASLAVVESSVALARSAASLFRSEAAAAGTEAFASQAGRTAAASVERQIAEESLSRTVGDYTYTNTAAGHYHQTAKWGENIGRLDRPYMRSPLTVEEVMAAGKPVPDPGGVPGALRWDVPGAFRGSEGTWQLVLNPETYVIYHFLFKN